MELRKFVKSMCLVLALVFMMASTALAVNTADFVDFPDDWSTTALKYAVDNGLIKGYEDNTIRANQNITRAEMAAIVNRAFGSFVEATQFPYLDVEDVDWFYSDMRKAVNMGTMQGSDNLLRPEDAITREEAFVVIARAYSQKDSDFSVLDQFPDKGDINGWSKEYLSFLTRNDYVNGFADGNLYPQSNLTRAELSQLIFNIIAEYVNSQEVLDQKDTYDGNVVINGGIAEIVGKTFNGDLVIGDGVGINEIIIKDTKIAGALVVRGTTQIKITKTTVGNRIIVNNPNNTVHFDNYKSEAVFKNVETQTKATWKQSSGGGGSGIMYYTVSFDRNYTGGGVYATERVPKDSPVSKPLDPERDGYTFGGWYTTPDLAAEYDFTTPVTGNITIYAKWTANKYIIDFDSGNHETFPDQEVTHGDKYGELPVPTKPGYDFGGWYDENGNKIESFDQVEITDHTTLTGEWTAQKYEITFDENGGNEVSDIIVEYDSAMTNLPTAHRPGYDFDGWYIGDQKIDSTTIVDFLENQLAVAKWTPKKYKLTFQGLTDEIEVTYDSSYPALPAGPTAAGFTFVGWFDGTTQIKEGNIVKITKDTKLYPKYTNKPVYVVTFDSKGGVPAISTQDIIEGEKAQLPTEPTKAGYVFAGWYKDEACTQPFDFNTPINAATTVYAKWNVGTYKLTFDGLTDEITVTYGGTYPTLPAVPEQSGKIALGWFDGTTQIKAGNLVEITKDTKLYPKYSDKAVYTVTFKNWDGSLLDTATAEHGTAATYTGATPTRPATAQYTYTFSGWDVDITNVTGDITATAQFTSTLRQYTVTFKNHDGASLGTDTVDYGTVIKVSNFPALSTETGYTISWGVDSVFVDGDKTITATREKNTYTIEYYSEDALVGSESYEYNEPVTLEKDITRTGYNFEKWVDEDSNDVDDGDTETPIVNLYPNIATETGGTVKLYAIWEPITYYIKFVDDYSSDTSPDEQCEPYTLTFKYDEEQELDTSNLPIGIEPHYHEGYHVVGWTENVNGPLADYINGEYADEGSKILNLTSEDGKTFVFYTVWQKNYYFVEYNGNKATNGTMEDSEHIYDVWSPLRKNTYERTGYNKFVGWNLVPKESTFSRRSSRLLMAEPTLTAQYEDEEKVWKLTEILGDTVEMIAVWQPNTYYVRYNANGGSGSMSISEYTYDEEKALTAENFTNPGYSFGGWAESATGAAKYEDEEVVKNLTAEDGATVDLYATWEEIEYTIVFDGNGATKGSMADVGPLKYRDERNLSANGFERDGYTFLGWAKSATATEPDYTDKQKVSKVFDTAGEHTLYAVWEANEYVLTFDVNGGKELVLTEELKNLDYFVENGELKVKVTYDKPYPKLPVAEWDEDAVPQMYFAGWKVNGEQIVAGDIVKILSDTTIVADWSEIYVHDVIFKDYTTNEDGTTTDRKAKVTNGEAIEKPTEPEKTGYSFDFWSLTKGGSKYDFTTKVNYNEPTTITLYPKWTANKYTVVYNGNGHTEGSTEETEHIYDQEKALRANGFKKTSHKFIGWDEDPAGKTVVHKDGASVKNLTDVSNGTVTLYAVWEKSEYTVIYDGNGATKGSMDSVVHERDTYKALTANAFEKTGYDFIGWAKSATATEADYIDGESVVNITEEDEITLYAVWNPKTFKLTFDVNEGKELDISTLPAGYYVDTETGKITVDVVYDAKYPTLPKAEYTDNSKTFGGWFVDEEAIVAGDTVAILDDTTLVAKWVDKHVVIYHDYYNEDGKFSSFIDYVEDGNAAVKPADPAVEGLVFGGWYTDADCTAEYDFATIINKVNDEYQTIDLYPKWEVVLSFYWGPDAIDDELVGTVNLKYNTAVPAEEIPDSRTEYGYWKDTSVSPVYEGDVNLGTAEYEHLIEFMWYELVDGKFVLFDKTAPVTESKNVFNLAKYASIYVESELNAIDGAVVSAYYTEEEAIYESILDVIFQYDNLAEDVYGKIHQKEKVFNKLISLGVIDENMNILNQAKFLKFALMGEERLEKFVYENVENELTVDAKESIESYLNHLIEKNDGSAEEFIKELIDSLMSGEGKEEMKSVMTDMLTDMVDQEKDEFIKYVNEYIDESIEKGDTASVEELIHPQIEKLLTAEKAKEFVRKMSKDQLTNFVNIYIDTLSDDELKAEIKSYIDGLGETEIENEVINYVNKLTDEEVEAEITKYINGLGEDELKEEILSYVDELGDAELADAIIEYIETLSDEDLKVEIRNYFDILSEADKKAKIKEYFDDLEDKKGEIIIYIKELSEKDLAEEISNYIAKLTEAEKIDEVTKYIEELEGEELKAEINSYISKLSDEELKSEVEAYINGLTGDELRFEIEKYINGLDDLTGEVTNYINGLQGTELEEKITEYISELDDLTGEVKSYIEGLEDDELKPEIASYIGKLDDIEKEEEISKYIESLNDTEKENEVTSYVKGLESEKFEDEIYDHIMNSLNEEEFKTELESYLENNDDAYDDLIREHDDTVPDGYEITPEDRIEYLDAVITYVIENKKADVSRDAANYITYNERLDYEGKIINKVITDFDSYIDEITDKALESTDSYLEKVVDKIVNDNKLDEYINDVVEKIAENDELEDYIDSIVEKIVTNETKLEEYRSKALDKILREDNLEDYIQDVVDDIVIDETKLEEYRVKALDKIVNDGNLRDYIDDVVDKIEEDGKLQSYVDEAVNKIIERGELETYIPSAAEKIVEGGDYDGYVTKAVDKIIANGELEDYIDRAVEAIVSGTKLDGYIDKAIANIIGGDKKQQYIEETALSIATGDNRDYYVEKAADTIVNDADLKAEYTQKAIDEIIGSDDEEEYVKKTVKKILDGEDRDKYINDTIDKIFKDGKEQTYIDKAVSKIVDKTPDDYSEIDKHIDNMFATAEKKAKLVDYINEQFIENHDFRTEVLPDAIDMIFADEESKSEVVSTIVDFVINDEEAFADVTEIAIEDLVKDAEFRSRTVERIAGYLEHHPEIMEEVVEFAKESELGVFVEDFIYELMNHDQFKVHPDNLFVAEAIERALAHYDYDSFMNEYIPDRFAGLIPDSVLKPIYENSLNGFKTQLHTAIDEANLGNTAYVDSGVTVKFNPIADILVPVFDKYLELKDKAEDKLDSNNGTVGDIYDNAYGENKYLNALVDIISIESFLNGDKSQATETLSGYSLKEFGDYYDIIRNASALLADTGKWYVDNMPKDKAEAAQEKLASKVAEYFNSILALVNTYAETDELPSYKDVLEIFEGDIPDRFFAKYESALSKVESKVNIDDKLDAVYNKLAQRGIVSKFNTVLDKFVASKFNREISEEQLPMVYTIIRRTLGYDDCYTIDNAFNVMNKVLTRFKVDENTFVIGNSKLKITIEREYR